VQTHRTHILEKLDLENTIDLVRYAIRHDRSGTLCHPSRPHRTLAAGYPYHKKCYHFGTLVTPQSQFTRYPTINPSAKIQIECKRRRWNTCNSG
jgi:hypothetical protein